MLTYECKLCQQWYKQGSRIRVGFYWKGESWYEQSLEKEMILNKQHESIKIYNQ